MRTFLWVLKCTCSSFFLFLYWYENVWVYRYIMHSGIYCLTLSCWSLSSFVVHVYCILYISITFLQYGIYQRKGDNLWAKSGKCLFDSCTYWSIIIYAFSFTYIYIRAKYRIGHRNKRKGYNLWATCRSEKCQFYRYNNMYAYSYIYILRARYI